MRSSWGALSVATIVFSLVGDSVHMFDSLTALTLSL